MIASIVLAAAVACTAPAKGTALRSAILDAMRREEKDPKIVYKVYEIKVCGQWAFVDHSPCVPYAEAEDGLGCAEGGFAVLQKSKGKWKAVPFPEGLECDPMEGEFHSAACFSAVRKLYPKIPEALFRPFR